MEQPLCDFKTSKSISAYDATYNFKKSQQSLRWKVDDSTGLKS